jgi:hypothetical protein
LAGSLPPATLAHGHPSPERDSVSRSNVNLQTVIRLSRFSLFQPLRVTDPRSAENNPPLGTLLGSAPVPVAIFGVAPLHLKIAQPFMAGTRCPPSSKVPPGTKGPCGRPPYFLPSLAGLFNLTDA